MFGRDAAATRIQRELADRYAHSVRAQVAEAEDPLAVRDDDHARRIRPVPQHFRHVATILDTQENAARALEDLSVLLAGETNRGRVDDRHYLIDVVDDDAEKQRLVAIVQRAQRN